MGAINIKHTGSGSDIALSSDGTNLLLNGTAIGGGGGGDPDLYRDNASSATTPSATGSNAVAIGTNSVASNTDSLAIGAYANSSGFRGVAVGRYVYATSVASNAFGVNAYSAEQDTIALGNSRAFGGANAFASAIGNNTTTYGAGQARAMSLGYLSKAHYNDATAIGRGAVTSSTEAVALGPNTTASANSAVAISGGYAEATAQRGVALGAYAKADVIGKFAFSNQRIGAAGDTQGGLYVLRNQTTDATPIALGSTGGGTPTNNQIILNNNSAYAFHGTIVARQQAADGTACAAWKVEGLIRREANAGTTVLVNSATTVLDNTPNWGMALSADTTNGGLKVQATGAASTDIRWVATIHTSEVTYA